MSSFLFSFVLGDADYSETIGALNATERSVEAFFLPLSFLQSLVFPVIASVALFLYLLYCSLLYGGGAAIILRYLVGHDTSITAPTTDSTRSIEDNKIQDDKLHIQKTSYQITNCIMNLLLGLAGLYYQAFIVQPASQVSIQNMVLGHEEYAVFAAAQLGYQLWSIPMGLFHVGESWPMMVHHTTVIVVSIMSAFMKHGFRYYTPFFYGMIEISSVPLALMNAMKDHSLMGHPFYQPLRVTFALAFLYLRVLLFVPKEIVYGTQQWVLWTQSNVWEFQLFMLVVWTSSQILLLLQLYWGYLIVKGLLKLAIRTVCAALKTNGSASSSFVGIKKKQ